MYVRRRALTTDRDADRVVVLVEDGDVHVGREVAPAELRREVGVHVERVLVDVQLVAASGSATAEKAGRGRGYALANRHDVVRQLEHKLVRLYWVR